ncbi:hypothetical protein GCM10009119_38320 [Algoriphagus jejuensis]|uniref:DUF4249 family protein n=1 Tax=Algoriphagus jejuensis TaxID=419934 RepID=A0ABP3YLC4_9BACT
MNNRSILTFFLALIFLSSCEQYLEVELPGQEPKLVMNVLLEPSDTLKVFLTKSEGVLEGNQNDGFEVVENATVLFKDPSGETFLLDFADKKSHFGRDAYYYLANPVVNPDVEYELIAETTGFPSINSKQRLPVRVAIKDVQFSNLGPSSYWDGADEYEIVVTFDDLPGRDFFEISGSIYGLDTLIYNGDTTLHSYSAILNPEAVNPAYRKDFRMRPALLFKDVFLTGENSQIAFRTTIWREMDIDITLNLYHVTESYFLYYDTADFQVYNNGDFLSQPVLVYNNINNGLGVFMARNGDQRVIRIHRDQD